VAALHAAHCRAGAAGGVVPSPPLAPPKPRSGEGWRRAPEGSSVRPALSRPLEITNPPEGAVYSVDPTLRREFQALPLRAVTAHPTVVRWLVDGAPVGSASSDRPVSWPLAVGSHRIEVLDAEGRRASTSVVVR